MTSFRWYLQRGNQEVRLQMGQPSDQERAPPTWGWWARRVEATWAHVPPGCPTERIPLPRARAGITPTAVLHMTENRSLSPLLGAVTGMYFRGSGVRG